MEQLLFVVYVLVTLWLVPFIPFVRHSGLPAGLARALYGFKILGGLGCAFYFSTLSTNVDYLAFNEEGKIQYELLRNNPALFFTDLTADIKAYGLGRIFETKDSFWGYLRFNLLYKLIGVLNLVTKGDFYFNTAVFSSVVFFAHLAYYRIFKTIYPAYKWGVIFASFLLPSALLYTSCFHKDGIVFISLALISYCLSRLLQPAGKKKYATLLWICAGVLVLFLFRNYVLVALLPAVSVALLCKYFPARKLAVILITYLIFVILFFGTSHFGSINLPGAVVQRKADFAGLQAGRTDIDMSELSPGFLSFARNLPEAINHALFRPYLWEFPQLPVVLTALEVAVYQLLVLLFIFSRRKNTGLLETFNVFGLLLFLNMMLIIGYTIPNVGAIVRYRSIFWIFLVTPLLCNIDWQRLSSRFKSPSSAT